MSKVLATVDVTAQDDRPISRIELLNKQTGEISYIDAGGFVIQDAKHDAVIKMFARLGNWEGFEREIDKKLDHQETAIAWWAANVRSDGRPSKTVPVLRPFSVEDAENLTGVTKQQISRWQKKLKDRMAYRSSIALAAIKKFYADASNNFLAQSTAENEWYTPRDIIERARLTLGEIDLDPASNAEANETIRAAMYYTADDSGLTKEWFGRVWINPPYSRDLMPAFVGKLIAEYQAGRTTAAILVSHNNTETAWFQSLAAASTTVCFPKSRIKFYRGDNVASPVNGQAFFYLGRDGETFAANFRDLGMLMKPA